MSHIRKSHVTHSFTEMLHSLSYLVRRGQQHTVCCSVLQCVAVCCSVLQCVAVCCSVLQCVVVCCSALQCICVAPWSVGHSVLHCVAVCCSVLQCVAVCCNMLQSGKVRCSMLQCAAECYSVLQCVELFAVWLWCALGSRQGRSHTEWRRIIGCRIFIGHFPRKSPVLDGCFARNDLQLKASYESSTRCIAYLRHVANINEPWHTYVMYQRAMAHICEPSHTYVHITDREAILQRPTQHFIHHTCG